MSWKIDKHVFDILKDFKPINYQYIIGVDTYDENMSAYCLMRRGSDSDCIIEVLLAKNMHKIHQKEFMEEVENLAKYFNAVTIWNDETKKFEKL